jgi:hypothetical protein
MRTALLIVLTLALAGCATVGGEKVDQLKPGTAIVPISLMGDTLAMREVGTTIFQNQRRDVDVASWHIDRHTESVAGQLVKGKGKFTVAQADTEEVRKTVKLGEDFWSGSNKIKAGGGALAAFAAQSRADYLLLIAPGVMGDPFMATNQTISGYGVYQRSMVGLKRSMNFITMRAVLLDGRSGEELARTQCAVSAPRSDWLDGDKMAKASDDMRSGIEKLFEDGLRKCLGSLNLG